MSWITRRNFITSAAAGLAAPMLLHRAQAAEPLKVGFVYVGPVGDAGWTWYRRHARRVPVSSRTEEEFHGSRPVLPCAPPIPTDPADAQRREKFHL